MTGLNNNSTYYFCAQGVAGSSTGPWSAPSSGVLIDPPAATGNYLVSGNVTFTSPATGPLYVGFYDQNSGNVYADVVGSKTSPPTSPAAYRSMFPPAPITTSSGSSTRLTPASSVLRDKSPIPMETTRLR